MISLMMMTTTNTILFPLFSTPTESAPFQKHKRSTTTYDGTSWVEIKSRLVEDVGE